MSTTEIIWQDPPDEALTDARRRTRYREFSQALRDNPGKWAILPGEKTSEGSAKNTAINLRNGKMRDFPKGEFETAVDGKRIFVRHVPSANGNAKVKTADVRLWARNNGHVIAARGAIPEHIMTAYLEAHPQRNPDAQPLED